MGVNAGDDRSASGADAHIQPKRCGPLRVINQAHATILDRDPFHDLAGTVIGPSVRDDYLKSSRRRLESQQAAQAGAYVAGFVPAWYDDRYGRGRRNDGGGI